jgi:hypothetical protein
VADLRQQVERSLRAVAGVVASESMFSEDGAWWADGKEIAHFHGDDEIEVRLTRGGIRARRTELRADPRVTLRPNSSDWLTVTVATKDDVDFVVGLVEQAATAHRPPPGQTAKPPPTGAALARRKHFH